MPVDLTVKQGDTLPVLTDTLTYSDGTAANLTGAAVLFIMKSVTSGVAYINTAATVVNPLAGTVSYTFLANDTKFPGLYNTEWVVTFVSGAQMTWPSQGYGSVSIEENLNQSTTPRIVGLADVKDHLRIQASDRTHDARLLRLIDVFTPIVENITGPVVPVPRLEKYDGGMSYISVMHRPIVSVISVVEYRGPLPYILTQVVTPDQGTIYSYMWDTRGRIVRRTVGGGITPFPPGLDQVWVTYTPGFQVTPPNIAEGMLEMVRTYYQPTEQAGRPSFGARGAIDSELPAGPATEFLVPPYVRELLGARKRHPSMG